jgi:hypothetical protein
LRVLLRVLLSVLARVYSFLQEHFFRHFRVKNYNTSWVFSMSGVNIYIIFGTNLNCHAFKKKTKT